MVVCERKVLIIIMSQQQLPPKLKLSPQIKMFLCEIFLANFLETQTDFLLIFELLTIDILNFIREVSRN